jgi:hypothetical protein
MERSVATSSRGEKLDKELARFDKKGPLIKVLEHAVFDRDGRLVREGRCDTMEKEFAEYQLHGEVEGNESQFMDVAREARDQRLVGNAQGQVFRAVGSLGDGSGYLVDANGRPLGRTPQAPVTPMKRKAADW